MALTEHTEKKAMASGAALGMYRGAQTVSVYSDVRSEFAALSSGAGVYDLGWRRKILLSGSDRVRWLNGMITNNVRDLPANRGIYAFLLNPQGRIQADLYAYNRGDYLLVDTEEFQREKVLGIFDHYIIMDDVEVTDSREKLTAIGIAGPKSRELLRRASLETPELGRLEVRDLSWHGVNMTLVRSDAEAVESYELWVETANVERVWTGLVDAGATPTGSSAYELLRIAAGIPCYGQDITERDLPQETEQTRALHFNKGCYVGQEIVERIHSRGNVHRMFTGFVVRAGKPASGDKIRAADKDVGEVTSTADLPLDGAESTVALGYIRREHGTPGKEVLIGETQATVSKLPFLNIFQT